MRTRDRSGRKFGSAAGTTRRSTRLGLSVEWPAINDRHNRDRPTGRAWGRRRDALYALPIGVEERTNMKTATSSLVTAADEQRRLAVLIDADNAQPSVVEGLLAEVAKFGVASVKRIY